MRRRGQSTPPGSGGGYEPLPVPAEDGSPVVRPDPGSQPGDGRLPDAVTARLRRPKPSPGRFSLLLIDNTTGKAIRVQFWPTRLDMVLGAGIRDRKMMAGWLLAQMVEATQRLAPDFVRTEEEKKPFVAPRIVPEPPPPPPFRPRWHRRMTGTEVEDDDGGI